MFKYNVTAINPLVLRRRVLRVFTVALRTLFLGGLCYLFLFPIFYLLLSALAAPSSLNDPSVVWIPDDFTIENFRMALTELHFAKSAVMSLQNTIFGTGAALISCSLVGYGFARYDFAEKKLAFMFVILTIIVPPQTLLISQFLNFKSFDFGGVLRLLSPVTGVSGIDLLSTSWVFFLPAMFACGLRNGLYIFIFRQFFSGLPKDLEEAARIDGAGALKAFVRVIVPITVPAFITVALFSFVWHWNDWYSSEMLFATEIKPLVPMLNAVSIEIGKVMWTGGDPAATARGILSAAGLLTVIVPLVLYIAAQRFFVESVERTGIVG